MNAVSPRNRLMPWYIGLVIVVIGVGYIGYQMYLSGCAIPPVPVFMVLIVLPVVYLVLMYLTLTSKE